LTGIVVLIDEQVIEAVMYCPKCGSQNADETRFCRGCGQELAGVTVLLGNKPQESLELAEKVIELKSLAIRGMMIGVGFLIISAIVFSIPPYSGIFWLLPLAFAFFFLSMGVSRLSEARGLKALGKRAQPAALPPGRSEYFKPPRSLYETDEPSVAPISITEHTTSHLQMNPDGETLALPKK
jgi:hypothetical protein